MLHNSEMVLCGRIIFFFSYLSVFSVFKGVLVGFLIKMFIDSYVTKISFFVSFEAFVNLT